MVIAWPRRESRVEHKEAASLWKMIEKLQQAPQLPCFLVPQPAHAFLAGEFANALLPEAFGDLPPEIKRAISMHDAGWSMIDAEQLQRLRSTPKQGTKEAIPVAFTAASAADTVQAWASSIGMAERLSAAGGLVVSEHFVLLARAMGKRHERFLAQETARRPQLQAKAAVSPADLERWTAALGFCDLLSLYLLAGLAGPASLPLAHPSSREAARAPQAALRFDDDLLCFSPRIFPEGFRTELEVLRHPVPEGAPRTETLRWEVA